MRILTFMMDLCPGWLPRTQLLAVFALCLSAQSPADIQQLSLAISTPSASLPAGAEIDVNLDVTNHADHLILIPCGSRAPERGGFLFSVTPSGMAPSFQVKMTSYLWQVLNMRAPRESVKNADDFSLLVVGMGSATQIEAGATVRFSAVLNNLYDMTTPGTYTVSVRKAASDVPVEIESNTLALTVTGPPPPAISIELSAISVKQFPIGSGLRVDVAVTNVSSIAINLPFDPSHPSAEKNGIRFTGVVTAGSTGISVRSKVVHLWKAFHYQYPFQITVKPGQTIHYSALISEILDLSAPGQYAIEASEVDPVTHLNVVSNPLAIVIK